MPEAQPPNALYATEHGFLSSAVEASTGDLSHARTLALDAARRAAATGHNTYAILALYEAARHGAAPAAAARLGELPAPEGDLLAALIEAIRALAARDPDRLEAVALRLEESGYLLHAAELTAAAATNGTAARCLAAPGPGAAAGRAVRRRHHRTAAGGRGRRPDDQGAGGRRLRRPGAHRRADRPAPVGVAAHGRDAPVPGLRQARRVRSPRARRAVRRAGLHGPGAPGTPVSDRGPQHMTDRGFAPELHRADCVGAVWLFR